MSKSYLRPLLLCSASVLMLAASPAMADDAAVIQELKAQAEKLKKQNEDLANRLLQVEQNQKQISEKVAAQPVAAPAAPAGRNVVAAGSMPGSFLVPGTDTSIKFGGYVKLDALYDLGTYGTDTTYPSTIHLNGLPGAAGNAARQKDVFRMLARQTRLNMQTETPDSEFGPVHSLVEVDFFGLTTSGSISTVSGYAPRLRHALMDFGQNEKVSFGQYFSTFQDLNASAETLDFHGPTGQIFEIQPQIRYTNKLNSNSTVAAAIENPLGTWTNNSTAISGSDIPANGLPSSNSINHAPDLIAYYDYADNWGHVRFSAIGRYIEANTGAVTDNHPGTFGYGGELSGDVHGFYGRDKFIYQLVAGRAISRYISDGGTTGAPMLGPDGTVVGLGTSNGEMYSTLAAGGYLSYQHWWAPSWRSNVTVGYQAFNYQTQNGVFVDMATNPYVNTRLADLHANVLWNPIKNATLGLEYMYGKRTTVGDLGGNAQRVQFSAQYNF